MRIAGPAVRGGPFQDQALALGLCVHALDRIQIGDGAALQAMAVNGLGSAAGKRAAKSGLAAGPVAAMMTARSLSTPGR